MPKTVMPSPQEVTGFAFVCFVLVDLIFRCPRTGVRCTVRGSYDSPRRLVHLLLWDCLHVHGLRTECKHLPL